MVIVRNSPLHDFIEKLRSDMQEQLIVAKNFDIPADSIPTDVIRADAIVFIIWHKGKGKIKIDLVEHDFHEGSVAFLFPNNYVSITRTDSDVRMRIVACERKAIENSFITSLSLIPILARHKPNPVTSLAEAEMRRINDYYDFLYTRLHDPSTPYKAPKIQSLLQSALYEIFDCIERTQAQSAKPQSRKEILTSKFIVAVGENFRVNRFVNYYAGLLCVSAKHLDAVVKEVSGKTPRVWIEEYVIMEAKILLQTTDMTIQEIAFALNFANQSFFGKFFRQITGQSPTAYRRLGRNPIAPDSER